jgi:hypothetical protein
MGTRVIKFEAPEGKVYDWAEPHTATIIDEEGNKTEEQEHLYANVLFLSKFDTIENYKLVDAPGED